MLEQQWTSPEWKPPWPRAPRVKAPRPSPSRKCLAPQLTTPPCSTLKTRKKKTASTGSSKNKLIVDDKNNRLYQLVNMGYKLFVIVRDFTYRILWVGSCLAFMWMMPAMFEIFFEQEAIMQKIQKDELISMMGDPSADAGQPIVRPF